MPSKRHSRIEDPPSASDSSEEEESESEEEEPLLKSSLKKSSNTSTSKSDPTPNSAEADSDEEEESDEDDSPEKPKLSAPLVNPNVKPIASKPMSDTPKPKKPSANSATPSKRPLETEKGKKGEQDSEQQKKKKRVSEVSEETEKKSGVEQKKMLIQRIFSDEDEIVLLKGIFNFVKKGKSPFASSSEFLESIKDSLHIADINKVQLVGKMKRLMHRYQKNAARSKHGKDPFFSKPHEQELYQLSKKIWGGGKEGNGGRSDIVATDEKKGRNQKSIIGLASPKRKLEAKREDEEDRTMHPYLSSCLGHFMSKEGLGLVDPLKQEELEQKWKKQFAKEAKICSERWELFRETANAVMNAME